MVALSLFAPILLNGSLMAPPVKEGICHSFYGHWPDSRDCVRAIDKLAEGPRSVPYTVDGDSGPHNLPLHVQSGECMIQVEMAGPRYPRTINLAPQDVITMANRILGTCVERGGYYGGFMALDMSVLKAWVVAEETKLDDPYPTSTSFLTVTISNVVPDWLQAGNFDPHIAWLLAQADLTASSGAFLPRMKAELRRRGNRFLAQSEMMRPRGQRIPWWRNPGVGNTNGTNDGGNRMAAILSQGVVDNSADTARKRLV